MKILGDSPGESTSHKTSSDKVKGCIPGMGSTLIFIQLVLIVCSYKQSVKENKVSLSVI